MKRAVRYFTALVSLIVTEFYSCPIFVLMRVSASVSPIE